MSKWPNRRWSKVLAVVGLLAGMLLVGCRGEEKTTTYSESVPPQVQTDLNKRIGGVTGPGANTGAPTIPPAGAQTAPATGGYAAPGTEGYTAPGTGASGPITGPTTGPGAGP